MNFVKIRSSSWPGDPLIPGDPKIEVIAHGSLLSIHENSVSHLEIQSLNCWLSEKINYSLLSLILASEFLCSKCKGISLTFSFFFLQAFALI